MGAEDFVRCGFAQAQTPILGGLSIKSDSGQIRLVRNSLEYALARAWFGNHRLSWLGGDWELKALYYAFTLVRKFLKLLR